MNKLLHIVASPRGDKSNTLKVSQVFLDAYREKYPDAEIRELNVWTRQLPEFDGEGAAAKLSFFGYDVDEWKTKKFARRANGNFSWVWLGRWLSDSFSDVEFRTSLQVKALYRCPYDAKTYFDMNPIDGSYLPCLKSGKRATTIHAAAVYYPGMNRRYGADHQANHLADWFELGGIKDVRSIWYHYNRHMSAEQAAQNFNTAKSFAEAAAIRWLSISFCGGATLGSHIDENSN